jgi:hypothetical protein
VGKKLKKIKNKKRKEKKNISCTKDWSLLFSRRQKVHFASVIEEAGLGNLKFRIDTAILCSD